MNRSNTLAVLAGLLLLILGGAVSADDGRINPPPYHFGGDTLYCDQGAGCSLLNLNGTLLGTWAESDIAAALAAVDQTGQNSLVGEVSGTYSTASLWAVPTSETNGNRQLCMIGYDEWGKRNDMCFAVTTDGKYLPAPLALGHVADCSMFSVGWWVRLSADHDIEGEIESIDATNGTVTFYIGKGHTYTASCDAVERIF